MFICFFFIFLIQIENFLKCVCICVAGLNQILRRFGQHYRSLYRLAHFYSNFLDFKVDAIYLNCFVLHFIFHALFYCF